MHGRVDSVSLGKSLHQMGLCDARQDQLAQAERWLEPATTADKKNETT